MRSSLDALVFFQDKSSDGDILPLLLFEIHVVFLTQ